MLILLLIIFEALVFWVLIKAIMNSRATGTTIFILTKSLQNINFVAGGDTIPIYFDCRYTVTTINILRFNVSVINYNNIF